MPEVSGFLPELVQRIVIKEEDKDTPPKCSRPNYGRPYICFDQMLLDQEHTHTQTHSQMQAMRLTGTRQKNLVLIFQAPGGTILKSKIKYSSSNDAIKKKQTGIKHKFQEVKRK